MPQQPTVPTVSDPFRALKMAFERAPSARRLTFRVNAQDDPRYLAPVSAFRIGIKHAEIGDAVLFIIETCASLRSLVAAPGPFSVFVSPGWRRHGTKAAAKGG